MRILRLIDETPFQELRLNMDGLDVHLVRESAGAILEAALKPGAPAVSGRVADALPAPSEPETPPGVSQEAESGTPVTAPLAGVFYRSPYPGEPPYVEVGASVREGDVVGILEVMKLMNLVKSPCDGTVLRICAANEQFVEFGQVLAIIGPGDVSHPFA